MLRKLVSTQARLLLYRPAARISELKEYVCLRESLNEEASTKSTRDFQELCRKYNLTPEDLTALFNVINSNPELLKEYIAYESWLQNYENMKYAWMKSPFYDSKHNLQSVVADLRAKYPDVASFEAHQPERVKAYQTLEAIFLQDAPELKNASDNSSVARFAKELEKRINGHVSELRHKNQNKTIDPHGVHASAVNVGNTDPVDEIARVLGEVYSKLQSNPAYVYGSVRHFLATHRQNLGQLEAPRQSQSTDAKSLEERSIKVTGTGEIVESIDQDNDLPLIIEEQNKALRQRASYNFLPWLNDRKLIYQATIEKCNPFWYGALGSLLAAYFLYKIYQGDATYTSLLAILGASAFCLSRHRLHSIRNNLDYLVQMNVHRDGRNLDLFIQKGGNQVTKIEGVPIRDFKLHRSDYTFEMPENRVSKLYAQLPGARTTGVRLSDMRRVGVARGAWVANYGQDVVFVPMNYEGNSSVLNKVFKGQEVADNI